MRAESVSAELLIVRGVFRAEVLSSRSVFLRGVSRVGSISAGRGFFSGKLVAERIEAEELGIRGCFNVDRASAGILMARASRSSRIGVLRGGRVSLGPLKPPPPGRGLARTVVEDASVDFLEASYVFFEKLRGRGLDLGEGVKVSGLLEYQEYLRLDPYVMLDVAPRRVGSPTSSGSPG